MKKLNISKKIIISFLSIFFFSILGTFNNVHAAATLYFTSTASSVYVGNTFTVYPRVNTGGSDTNSYYVSLSFTSNIQPISISKGGSICSLFTQDPSFSGSTASISCGLPSPGFNGSSGVLGSITFKAVSTGTATITMGSASQVLANDGSGTNILGSTGHLTINITEPPPPPIGTPTITASVGSSEEWISEKNITFNWTVPSGATGFSYILTEDQNASVPRTTLGSNTSKSYSDLTDGRYYFKIVATDGDRWSNAGTYTLLIDTTAPDTIDIVSEPSNDKEIEIPPLISFNATDATSGIDHYELKIDDGEYIVVTNPYQIESISSGQHTITIKAFDMAGNFKEESITMTVIDLPAPTIITPADGSYLPMKDKLFVDGTTTPNSIVSIYLNDELIGEVTSDGNGYFSFTYNKILLPGNYELYTMTKNENGILGIKSNIAHFKVDAYAVRIGNVTIPSWMIITVFILLIVLFVLLLLLFLRRRKKKNDEVREKLEKTLEKVDEEFEELEKDMQDRIGTTLDAQKDIPKKVERIIEKHLATEIQEAKTDIEKTVESLKKNRKEKKKKKESSKTKNEKNKQ